MIFVWIDAIMVLANLVFAIHNFRQGEFAYATVNAVAMVVITILMILTYNNVVETACLEHLIKGH